LRHIKLKLDNAKMPESPHHSLRVLIVDDDVTNQVVLASMVNKLGHIVAVVSNGVEALAILYEKEFDLIFMDIQMPVMDGIKCTECIRACGKSYHDIVIVAATACALPGDKERFFAAGMNHYISKPIEIDEVKTVLEKAQRR